MCLLRRHGLVFLVCGLLAGCVLPPAPAPNEVDVVWPLAAPARRSEARFPDRALVAQLERGTPQAELLRWFGPPDLIDDADGAWDYVFHFHSGGGVTTCRYRARFDGARTVRGFQWQPAACGDWLGVKAPVQAQGKAAP